ncbi:hypothetical protein ACB092_10G131900 [Castanea dentata]
MQESFLRLLVQRDLGEMAPSTHPVEVGIEAFTLLEVCLKQKTRPPLHHRQPHQLPSTATTSNQSKGFNHVAQKYGGVLIVEYRNKKPLLPHRIVN